MQKDPAKRYQSMLDFAKALTSFLNKLNKATVAAEVTQVMQPVTKSRPVETLEDTRWEAEPEIIEPPKPTRGERQRTTALPELPQRISRNGPPRASQETTG